MGRGVLSTNTTVKNIGTQAWDDRDEPQKKIARQYGHKNNAERQTVAITDVISEGPIQGLVKGSASVFLNGNRLGVDKYSGQFLSWTGVRTTFSLSSVNATINTSNLNLDGATEVRTREGFTEDVKRYWVVRGVEEITGGYASSRGQSRVTSIPDSWVSTYKGKWKEHIPVRVIIKDEVYVGIITADKKGRKRFKGGYLSGTSWTGIKHPELKVGTSYKFYRDKIIQVDTVNDTAVTLAEEWDEPSGSYAFDDLGYDLEGLSNAATAKYHLYPGSSVQFRPGNLYQPVLQGRDGNGATAKSNNLSIDLEKSNNFGVEGKSPAGTQAPTILTASDSSGFNLSSEQISIVDVVKIKINYPGGFKCVNKEGKDRQTTIRYKFGVSVKRPGDTEFEDFDFYTDRLEPGFRLHTAKTSNAIAFEETIDLARYRPFDDFKVHIERRDSTEDPGFVSHGRYYHEWTNLTQAQLSSTTAIMTEKLTYPLTAVAKVSYSTKDFQSLPNRSYHCKGKLVKVPSNYVTRDEATDGVAKYTRNVTTGDIESTAQDWDGAFRSTLVYTNNPAWVFYDMITNDRYGLGDFVKESDLDIYALYRIGKYCDELVDDLSGLGTKEPRYTMNTYLTKSVEAYKVLKDMASNFLTMLYYLDGKMLPVQDTPSGPVYAFSKANVKDGEFSYENTGTKTRINQIVVKWNNPENGYRQEQLLIEDKQNIVREGKVVSTEAVAYGCTSESQAIRFGRWKLYTALNQQEIVTFETGLQGSYIAPGDVITINDSDRTNTRYAGRISGRLTNGLTKNTTTYAARDQIASNASGFDATERSQPTFMQGDIQLPTSVTQDRVIFEYGGTTAGVWIGVRDVGGVDTFTFRAGDGGVSVSATNTAGVYKEIAIADIPEFDGNVHTVSWEFHPANGTGRFWIDGRLIVDEATTDGTAFTNSTWAGANVGGWGQGYGGIAGNFAGTQWIDTIASDLSVYTNQTAFYPTKSTIPLDNPVTLNTGSDYTLGVVTIQPGAFAQEDMVIDGNSITAGELVRQAYITSGSSLVLSNIDSASAASNAYGANSGNTASLMLAWKDDIRVETRDVTTAAGTGIDKISVSSAYAVAPDSEAMWVLNETVSGSEVASGGSKYKVLSVSESDNKTYTIGAGTYIDEKFDAIEGDFNTYVVEPLFPVLRETEEVPPVQDVYYSIEPGGNEDGNTIILYWKKPEGFAKQARQPDGSIETVRDNVYEFYRGAKITHNIDTLDGPFFAESGEDSFVIPMVPEGDFEVAVQTMANNGLLSEAVVIKLDVTRQFVDVSNTRYPGELHLGGSSDASLRLVNDGGTNYVEFTKSNYTFHPPQLSSDAIINASTGEATYRQAIDAAFPTTDDRTDRLGDAFRNTDHYLILDADDAVDRIKLCKYIRQSTIRGGGINYWHDTGTGLGTGSSVLTGTISKEAGSSLITGDGNTSFCSELAVGAAVLHGLGTSAAMAGFVTQIYSNSSARLSAAYPVSLSSVNMFTNNFRPDTNEDVVLGRVFKDSTGLNLQTFVNLGTEITAAGIAYDDATAIENLKPNEIGSDNSFCQLNAGIEINKTNGGLTFNENGAVKSQGETSESSMTAAGGYFLGYNTDNSKYVFGVGNDTENLIWNGTDLSVTGAVTATSGSIGGWTMTGSSFYAGLSTAYANSFAPSGFTASSGMLLHSQGSIHAQNFFINSDGSAGFKGSVSSATGVFFGDLLDNSITANNIAAGAITAEEIGANTITGENISVSGRLAVYQTTTSGSILESSYAALDGSHEKFRIYAGDNAAASAPFRVSKTGQVVANNLQLFDSNDNLYFDSSTGGFTPSALRQIAQALQTRIFNFAEVWTGDLNASDSSTFENVTLTGTTNITSSLRIPVTKFSATAQEEFFGKRNNPINVTINLAQVSYDTSISQSDLLKPDGTALDRDLKVGEVVRLTLINLRSNLSMSSVTGMQNALTGNPFANPQNISGPTSYNFIYFEITATGTNSAEISVPDYDDISIQFTSTDAKPNTLLAARNKIPTSFSYQLDRNTASAAGTTTNVISSSSFTVTFNDSSPTSNEYNVKTISEDVVDDTHIFSTVEVQLGEGAVDSQGYISRSATEVGLTSNSYYYHSTLSVTGGDSDKQPSNRLFEVSVPTSSSGFILEPDLASQSSQQGALTNLDLTGDIVGPSALTITPSTSDGTVTIDGNLVVTGTQTVTSTSALTVGDKTLTVSDGASSANASTADLSGIVVGDNISSILWDYDVSDQNEWKLTDQVSSSAFRSAVDGNATRPAYNFGTRTTKTGLFASDFGSGDQITIVTKDNANNARETLFNSSGVTSHAGFVTASNGHFENDGGTWTAAVTDNTNDFKFANSAGNALMYFDTSASSLGIGTTAPKGRIHIRENPLTSMPTPSTLADSLVIENDDHAGISIHTPSNKYGTLSFGDTVTQRGKIEYQHASDVMKLYAGGSLRLEIDNTLGSAFRDGGSVTAPTYLSSVLDLFNNHVSPSGTELSSLTFSNYGASSNIRQTRAAIGAGWAESGTGYGFIDIMTAGSEDESTGNSAASGLRLVSTSSNGRRMGLNIGQGQEPSQLVHFKNSLGALDKESLIRIETGTVHVDKKAGLLLSIGNGSAQIHGKRSAADNGSTDIELITSGSSGPNGTGIHMLGSNNHIGILNNDPAMNVQIDGMGIETTQTQVNSASSTTIASFPVANFRGAKYIVSMEDTGTVKNHLMCELISVYEPNDNSVEATEYAIVFTGASKGVTFSVEYDSGTGKSLLKATPDQTSTSRWFNVTTIGMAKTTT